MEQVFKVHLRGIIDLLANHLYSGPEVFIRELLQNGSDAVTARRSVDPSYHGKIHIELTAKKKAPPTILFADDGIGLTEEEVHRFLATIGDSSKRGRKPTGEKLLDFIGQFGVGLLSCFMVSEEIALVTRSANGGPALEWRGRSDGTYTLKKLEHDLDPGTQVYLTCKEGSEEFFEPERLKDLIVHYGGLLSVPIWMTLRGKNQHLNKNGVPWREKHQSEKERTEELLSFGRNLFESDFFDAVPLQSKAGDAEGVAYVLPHSPPLGSKRTHRVYLKGMLLSANADNLLPDWAFFVKAIVNANDLRPTASREAFYEDSKLASCRESLGRCLRNYLLNMGKWERPKLEKFLDLHDTAIRALAAEDDDVFSLFIDWLPFETSLGEMTLSQVLQRQGTIRVAPTVDLFRQVSAVAAAQDVCIVNAGYAYGEDLIRKFAELKDDAAVEEVDPTTLSQSFEELDLAQQDEVADFMGKADAALKQFRCSAEMKGFEPETMPAFFTIDRDGQFLRSLERSKDVANPMFQSILENIGKQDIKMPAQLCFNFRNPLVKKLITLESSQVIRRSVQLLYVHSLLWGRQPLSAKEMAVLNDGLLDLINWSVEK